MKKIKKISSEILAIFIDMVEGVDELRLELENYPTLLIRRGPQIQTMEGFGELICLGILAPHTTDEFSYAMEVIVYDKREKKGSIVTGTLYAFAVSRLIDTTGKSDTACTIINNQVTTIFRYEQEALSNHADRWLAELAKMGYPEISIR